MEDNCISWLLSLLNINSKPKKSIIVKYLKSGVHSKNVSIYNIINPKTDNKLVPVLFKDNFKQLSEGKFELKCIITGETYIEYSSNLPKGYLYPIPVSNEAKKLFYGRYNAIWEDKLFDKFEKIFESWNWEDNGLNVPWRVSPSSDKKCSFICKECGYKWKTNINNRTQGMGCPACAGNIAVKGRNTLVDSKYWDLFVKDYYDFEENSKYGIDLDTLTIKSSKGVYWKCPKCNNKFYKPVYVVIDAGKHHSCAVCSNQDVKAGINDITQHKNWKLISSEWDYDKNTLSPETISFGTDTKVWWKCKTCGGSWKSTPRYRLVVGIKCPICYGRRKVEGINTLYDAPFFDQLGWDFKKNKISPKSVTVGNSTEKVWWICPHGHHYKQVISEHVRYFNNKFQGCPICTHKSLVQGVNDFKSQCTPKLLLEWDYDKNIVKPEELTEIDQTKVWWKCSVCSTSWRTSIYKRVKEGQGCPVCAGVISREEIYLKEKVKESLDKVGSNLVMENNKRIGKYNYEIDIYFPEKKIGFEYNGFYWHSDLKRDKKAHINKNEFFSRNGIKIYTIWEDDLKFKEDLVLRFIMNKLGLGNELKISARDCSIKKVEAKEARRFFKMNHLRGYSNGLCLGLYKDEILVSAIIIKNTIDNGDKYLNIVRFASSCNVRGGFSRLLKYLERQLRNITKGVITFADREVSDGALYLSNGFKVDKVLNEDYMIVEDGIRRHKFNYRLDNFKNRDNLLFFDNMTEFELEDLNNLLRVWDSGKVKFRKVWRLESNEK